MELLDANIALFVAASLAVIVAPGPDNIYVLTRGVAQGREVALASAWGMCSGLLFHTTLAALGLSAILARSAVAFSVVKYAGAAYLIYLGVRTLLSREGFAPSAEDVPVARLGSFFLRGLTMNLLNPKVAVFFLAFLPQFSSPATDGAALRLMVLGLIFTFLSVVVFSAIALSASILGDRLNTNPRYANALRWLTTCVLVGLGVRLASRGANSFCRLLIVSRVENGRATLHFRAGESAGSITLADPIRARPRRSSSLPARRIPGWFGSRGLERLQYAARGNALRSARPSTPGPRRPRWRVTLY